VHSTIYLLEVKLNNAIPTVAVNGCHELTSGMTILPRELRDMVYDHLPNNAILHRTADYVAPEIRGKCNWWECKIESLCGLCEYREDNKFPYYFN
jgi:hypothetical protein